MTTVLNINGSAATRNDYVLLGGTLYGKGEIPSLRLLQRGLALASFASWDNQPVTLVQDGVTIFAGDTVSHLDHFDPEYGWVREWTCAGLAHRALRIPVTDSNTLTDTAQYNLSPQDGYAYIPSRAGRSVAQIVADVLEMADNSAALSAHGIGAYTSSGSGASGVAVVSGGTVASVGSIVGGSGYTTAPSVIFCGGGGTGATGTAAVSGGAVTGVTMVTNGSGYTSPPVVLFSRLPSATLTDLDALTIIPPQRVTISGERILQALESFIQTYHPNQWLHVDVTGQIRVFDPRTWAASPDITLTLDGSDPRVPKPSLSRDYSQCYQRVLMRGNTIVYPFVWGVQPAPGSSRTDNGITEDFAHDGLTNAQAKTDWKASDWNSPGQTWGQATAQCSLSGSGIGTTFTITNGGYSYASAPTILFSGGGGTGAAATATITGGVVTAITRTAAGSGYTSAPTMTFTGPSASQSDLGTCTMPSTTSVTITSANPAVQWAADYWDQSSTGHLGTIVLSSDTITGITQQWTARITANTSLSPGGTSTLTIDNPAPATTYTSYQIFGTGGGASVVGRRYKVSNAAMAAAMQQYFPYPVAYRNADGLSASLTTSPSATVFYSASGTAPYQELGVGVAAIDPDAGTITLSKPVQLVFSADGVTPVWPDDVQVFIPVASGILESVYPPNSGGSPVYAGTSHSVEGLSETKVVTVREWRDYSNQSNMTAWASEMLDSLKDTVIEGDVAYMGLLSSVLTPGHAVNLPGNPYTSGWESAALPVQRVTLEYHESRSPTSYTTTLHVSNRRALYAGEAFMRPSQVGLPVGIPDGQLSFAMTAEGGGALEASAAASASNVQPGLSTGNATGLGATDLSDIPLTPMQILGAE